ncbi:MAG: 3-phosphoshikimate 1-carboxyvinyltransferase [Candidatus Mycalebacterium zealandia]|nr:MAG: 3-phosphoshikimate 1-carboxyvinyltransferase [Candidatus Mycalebacterium zealandia]
MTVSGGGRPVTGRTTVPADKSISHRALIIGCLSRGGARITNLLDSEDIVSTKNALRLLGARIETSAGETAAVSDGLAHAGKAIDAGNSGTTARLLAGVLSAQRFESTVTGDKYLKQRPMERVITPLSLMGADISSRGGKLPVSIKGSKLRAIEYEMPVASAQVKSAILLAGLYADGDTKITEPKKTRDHTEIMLGHFGAVVRREGNTITLSGGGAQQLTGGEVAVPADISSAIFPVAAAVINSDSRVVIENVGINPARAGGLEILQKMGADVRISNRRKSGGEDVADIEAQGGRALKGIEINGDLIPRAIDELPAIAVVACFAQGVTKISDAAELRVKESDRIKSMTEGLGKLGARVEETPDGMLVTGGGLTGGACSSAGDHRVAMALGVAATAADGDSRIEDAGCVAVSFRDFFPFLEGLRARK